MSSLIHREAERIAKMFARDDARKRRILARSPHLAYGLDAVALDEMSSRELAERELKELGVEVGENDDPVKLLDVHHAGRHHARSQFELLGYPYSPPMLRDEIEQTKGGSQAMDCAGGSFVDKYLKEQK